MGPKVKFPSLYIRNAIFPAAFRLSFHLDDIQTRTMYENLHKDIMSISLVAPTKTLPSSYLIESWPRNTRNLPTGLH